MREAKGSKKAKRTALLIMGVLLLVAVPYGMAILRKYRTFSEYVNQTLDDPSKPPRWRVEVLTPEACVAESVAWRMACPGEKVFCTGGIQRAVRDCMASQDRTEWCDATAEAWATTRFGYHECEARIAAASSVEAAKAEDKHCPVAYRGLANHCRSLARRSAAP